MLERTVRQVSRRRRLWDSNRPAAGEVDKPVILESWRSATAYSACRVISSRLLVDGGETAQESVRLALAHVPPEAGLSRYTTHQGPL